jgi:SLT domain-containing protein
MWNSIFELLHSIAKAFREAWNDGTGEKIAADILDIFTNIHRTIGNIADAYRHAWDDGGTGEKYMKTLLGMVNDFLDAVKNMTKDTADWAKTLNLKPYTKAVTELLAAIRPLTKDVWDGLEWGYKNLLLPLAKYMITYVLPDFIRVLADVLKLLGAAVNALKPLLKVLFDGFLLPLAKWTGGAVAFTLEAITTDLDNFASWISKHLNLKKAWDGFWGGIADTFKETFGGSHIVQAATNEGMLSDQKKFDKSFKQEWDNFWSKVESKLSDTWNSAKKTTSKWGQNLADWWDDTSSKLEKKWNGFWTSTGVFLSTSWSKMKKTSSDWGSWIQTWWSSSSSNFSRKWNSSWSSVGSYLSSKWSGMKTSSSKAMSSISGTVSSWNGKISSGWKKTWSGLSSWFSKLWSGIKSGAKSGLNGVIGFLNGAIKGINRLWGKFTSNKTLISTIKPMATGGIVGGQQMVMLNDGGGSDWKELFQTPEGQYGMLQERNAVTALPVGTRVYNGGETRSIMNMAGITHYAGGGVVGGIAKFFSSGWDKLTAIGDWLKHPITNLKNVISSFTKNLSSTTSAFTSLGRGMVSSIGSMAGSWIKTKLESLQKTLTPKNPGGSGVTRWAPYVKQALSANGLSTSQAMISKVLRQIQTESGGNPNAIQGNIGDINNRTGDLAKGLMQTISATFNAYAFKGHHNIFNGYDNLLAALNYAKHRYGSSLSYLGKGHGYENGGLIRNDGMYRVGEHNLAEMVLPLTKPARAVELMQDALSVMGLTAYDLVAPGIVNEPSYTTSGVTNSGGSVSTQSLSALDAQTIGSIIADTLKELLSGSTGSQGDADMDVALKVNDDVLGRVVIKAINKRAQKLGYNPLPN